MPRLLLTEAVLDLPRMTADLERDAQSRGEGCGAVCSFVGVVRSTHEGRKVVRLEYEAFEPLVMKAFALIDSEIAATWPDVLVAMHHRIGELQVGDASVIVAAASAHRAQAFQACRYGIERIKQIAPIWKHEFFEDGDAWVAGATTDVEDESARRRALDVACA